MKNEERILIRESGGGGKDNRKIKIKRRQGRRGK